LRAGTCASIAVKATNKEQVSSAMAGQQTYARTKKRKINQPFRKKKPERLDIYHTSSASLKRWHLRGGTCASIAVKATNKEQVSSVMAEKNLC